MKKCIIWMIVFSPLFLAYQCVEKDKCYTEYHLQFEAVITPERDTFSLNDTLWFEIRIGDSLFDIYSQQWIPSNRVTFPLYFTMTKLEPTDRNLPAEGMFEFVLLSGNMTFERLSQFTNIRLDMDKENYFNISKFGFIPKRTGIFEVTPNVQRIDIEDINVGDDGCRPFVKDVSFRMNGSDSTNGFYLISASGSPIYQNYSEENFKKAGTFAFVVIE